MNLLNRLRYKIAWWRRFLHEDFRFGDPSLGKTRDERNRNLHLMFERKLKREPKPEDYGLDH